MLDPTAFLPSLSAVPPVPTPPFCGSVAPKGGSALSAILADLNWELLAVLVAVSAVVAYVGDVVGMRIGKKRISLFGLRPRHTSSVVTALTGVLITLATLMVVSAASETVRTALLGMKFVQRQVTDLTGQLQQNRQDLESLEFRLFQSQEELQKKARALGEVEKRLIQEGAALREAKDRLENAQSHTKDLEDRRALLEVQLTDLQTQKTNLSRSVAKLQGEAKALREGLQQVREGRIAVLAGELLSQLPVEPKERTPRRSLDLLLDRARQGLAARLAKSPEQVSVALDEEERAKALALLSGTADRRVLRLIARSNAVLGETVYGQVQSFRSVVVVKEGEVLAAREVPSGTSPEEAEQILHVLLREVNQKVVRRGVLPDPLRGTVGNLSATEFYDGVERIAESRTSLTVSVLAQKDIYTEGPVAVRIVTKAP